jgi:sugar lactone lactonase YvrE
LAVAVKVDGKPLQQTDGRRVSFSADGIALTPDGRYLYWQAVTGKTLYRLATDALQNAQLSPQQVAERVEVVGIDGPADGLWFDERGRLCVSSVEHHAIRVRDGERFDTLLRDRTLVWPDTFSESADGTIRAALRERGIEHMMRGDDRALVGGGRSLHESRAFCFRRVRWVSHPLPSPVPLENPR